MFCRSLLIFSVAALSGCAGAPDDLPELGTVTGVVTIDGEPVAKAIVNFRPVEGGLTSQSLTGEDGRYELNYLREQKGAKVGTHFVQITTFEDPVVEDDGTKSGGRKELMPAEYSRGDLEKRDVAAGENTINFEIKKGSQK